MATQPVTPQADPWQQAADDYAKTSGGKAVPAAASSSAPNEDWKLWGAGGNAAALQPQAPHWGSSLSDTLDTVGSHIKNMVAGPYHAFTDAATPQEVREFGPGSEAKLNTPLAHVSLGVKRMFVDPTVQGIQAGNASRQQGDTNAAAEHYMDAIPMVGPWARNVENDVQSKGAVAGLAGLTTDVAAPKVLGKIAGAGLRLGGRVARIASASPETRALAGTRAIIPGAPSQLLTRALKPSVAYPDFEESAQQALPNIVQEKPAPGVQGFADAADRARVKTAKTYQDIKSPYANDRIDTTPMVGPQLRGIPATNLFEQPGILNATRRIASPYDMTPETRTVTSPIVDERGQPITRTETVTPQKPTLNTLDNIRQDTNAKLRSFYNKDGGDRNAALSNPTTARIKAVNDSSRNLVYGHLSEASGIPEDDIRANQDMFGHLTDVGKVAGKRATVFGRQSPVSLQESIALNGGNPLHTAVDYLGQRALRGATNSDALVNSAVDRFRNPKETPLIAGPGIGRKLGMGAGNMARGIGKKLYTLPLGKNPLLYSNANRKNR